MTYLRRWAQMFGALLAGAMIAVAPEGSARASTALPAPEACTKGPSTSLSVIASWLAAMRTKDQGTRAWAAAKLARCGDAAVPALIASLEQSLAREAERNTPEDQSDYSDGLIWALTNDVGLPEEPLIAWLRSGVADPPHALPDTVVRERLDIVTSILGARRSLTADRVIALLTSSDLILRQLGVALVPTIRAAPLAPSLLALGDTEGEPALRHAARLAAIAFGGTGHALTWIEREPVPERRKGLTEAAATSLPLSFLFERLRAPGDIALRRDALDALGRHRSLPAGAIAPLLEGLEDPALRQDHSAILLALKRIDPKAPEWARYLDRLLAMVRNADPPRHASALLVLTRVGRSASAVHAPLRSMTATPADIANGQLDDAIIETAPDDHGQVELAVTRLERESSATATGTAWVQLLPMSPRIDFVRLLADHLTSPTLLAERQKLFVSALSEAIRPMLATKADTEAIGRLITASSDTARKTVLCKALIGHVDALTRSDYEVDDATSLWWSACRPQLPPIALPTPADVRKAVQQQIRDGEDSDPLESYIADSDYDTITDRSWFEVMLGDRSLPPSDGLTRRWCHTIGNELQPPASSVALLAKLDWVHASVLLGCPVVDTPEVTAMIWNRIIAQPDSFLDYVGRKGSHGCSVLRFAVAGRDTAQPLSAREFRTLNNLMDSDSLVQACVVQLAGSLPQSPEITRALLRVSTGRNTLAAEAAIETLARTLPDSDRHWPAVVQRATQIGLIRSLRSFGRRDGKQPLPWVSFPDEDIQDVVVTARKSSGLPPFPWPPPIYASRATFGVDVTRSLLGAETETLEAAYGRLTAALESVDPQYSSGLFGASGGFVLLTRMEQVDDAGNPVAKPYRWRAYQQPPATMTDYLVRLFLAPEGFYRTLAFVFTNQTSLAPGTGALPDIDAGDTVLPQEIGDKLLSSVHVYLLVYAYKKKDTDQVLRVWRDLTGKQHLDRAQILTALSK